MNLLSFILIATTMSFAQAADRAKIPAAASKAASVAGKAKSTVGNMMITCPDTVTGKLDIPAGFTYSVNVGVLTSQERPNIDISVPFFRADRGSQGALVLCWYQSDKTAFHLTKVAPAGKDCRAISDRSFECK